MPGHQGPCDRFWILDRGRVTRYLKIHLQNSVVLEILIKTEWKATRATDEREFLSRGVCLVFGRPCIFDVYGAKDEFVKITVQHLTRFSSCTR